MNSLDKINTIKIYNNKSISSSSYSATTTLFFTYYKNPILIYYNKIKELESFVDSLIYDNNQQTKDHGLFITNQPVSNTITGTAEIKILGSIDYDELTFTWKISDGMGYVDLYSNETTKNLTESSKKYMALELLLKEQHYQSINALFQVVLIPLQKAEKYLYKNKYK